MSAATDRERAIAVLREVAVRDGHDATVATIDKRDLTAENGGLTVVDAMLKFAGLSTDIVRPTDDAIDVYLRDSIRGAKRCGIQRSEWLTGWFVPWSPRNDNENAEGTWSDWVALAQEILATDHEARAAFHGSNGGAAQ